MTIKKIIPFLAICICILFNPVEAENMRIAVIISNEGKQYDEAFLGYKQHLERQNFSAKFDVFNLKGDAQKAASIIPEVRKNNPDLIFSLGTLAVNTVLNQVSDIPFIACLFLKIDKLKNVDNATGMSLEIPIRTQLQWLKQFLPEVKTVGVLYSEKDNKANVEEAKIISDELGLKLEAMIVNTPQDLPLALNNIINKKVDVLWGVPDNVVLNPQTFKEILLFSFRNLIPFIGLSSSWVEAGALYALERDYVDIGNQCGEMTISVLLGKPVQTISPVPPRKVKYSINVKTAEYMKVKIPGKIIQNAESIY